MQSEDKRHPIQVVARRTGLTPDVLRVWERRYQAVTPARSSTGRRLYSDHDVERLLLLRRATLGGRSIGQVARIPSEELRQLVTADEVAGLQPPRPRRKERRERPLDSESAAQIPEDPGIRSHLAACLEAIKSLDAGRLEATLARAALTLSRPVLMQDILLPLMAEIGDQWRIGALRVAHEHLASAVVRSFLGAAREAFQVSESAPTLVVTTPAGQLHEFGAMVAAATASSEGWRVIYLGPNLPAEEIAAAVRQTNAKAVALSLVYPADDPHLPEELFRVRRAVGEMVAFLVGGRAAHAYATVLEGIGASRLSDMAALRRALESVRSRPLGESMEASDREA